MDAKNFPKPPSLCNCTNMRRASRAMTQFYDDLLAPSGLKVTQYSLLNHLKRLGPLTMNELSTAIRLERTTLVRNLKPLEKRGLISIAAEKSSQARRVHITESGLISLAAAVPYWNQAQQNIKELLTEEEHRVFHDTLQKIESIVP
jgi:DNA-binding MarR family transcriptional regulator